MASGAILGVSTCKVSRQRGSSAMGFFVTQAMTSIVGAILAVEILKVVFGGILGPAAHAVKTSLFVGVGAAINVAMGDRSFVKKVRGWRQGFK